jgi:hypothetical protein
MRSSISTILRDPSLGVRLNPLYDGGDIFTQTMPATRKWETP